MSHRLRILAALAALALPMALAACGEEHDKTVADTEAIYLEIDDVFYQVQISRELNPFDREDQSYLVGVPPELRELSGSETWFGVFIRAYNLSDDVHPAARDFKIVDTTGEVFRPIPLGPDNIFAYRGPRAVQPNDTLPAGDTIALGGPTGGSLLLFKLDDEALANRPLEFITTAPSDPEREYIFTVDV